jgi:hypothetical protein
MKRSFLEWCSALSTHEMHSVAQEVDKTYRDRLCEENDVIFGADGDCFKNHLLPILSHTPVRALLPLRTVCKKWSVWITETNHLTIFEHSRNNAVVFPPNNVTSLCKNITSLEIDSIALGDVDDTPKITKLKVFNMRLGYGDKNPSLTRYKSLQELHICGYDGSYIDGWSFIKQTLTKLRCHVYNIEPSGLLTLVNLTHLSIKGVYQDIDIAKTLKNLTYLESDSPGHFVSFTGRGILRTPSTMCGLWGVGVHEKRKMKKTFDAFYKGSYEIDVEGLWDIGTLVSGSGEIKHHDRGEFRFVWKGSFVEGKRVGTIEECD